MENIRLSAEHFLKRHGYFLIVLSLLGLSVYSQYLWVYPLDGDNLAALDVAVSKTIPSLFRGSTVLGLPVYRPVPYITLILQYKVFGLHTLYYFLFNIAIWIACSWLIYLFVAHLTKSRIAALIAAALLLVDVRAFNLLSWLGERQSSLSGLFGFCALLLAIVSIRYRWRRMIWITIFVLLLLSPLSKEYGLAFSGALILLVVLSKHPDWKILSVIALLAVTIYSIMRVYSGVTSVTGYCEDMGFFRDERLVCYGDLTLSQQFPQYAYNVAASFVGIIFPDFFSRYGAIHISASQLLITNIPVFLLAFLGLIKFPRKTLPLVGLIFLNGLLSFVLYRERNQIVGMLGLYASAGIGLAYLYEHYKQHFSLKWAGLLVLTLILSWQIVKATHKALNYYESTKLLDPCKTAEMSNIDLSIARYFKEKYQMPNPKCSGSE